MTVVPAMAVPVAVPVWRRERVDAVEGCRELVEAVEGEEHVDAVGRR